MMSEDSEEKVGQHKDCVIASPDRADLRFGLDASSTGGTLIISATVHYAKKLSICYINLWVQELGYWDRLYNKEISELSPPNLGMLLNIVTKYYESEEELNIRIELGIKRLQEALKREIYK